MSTYYMRADGTAANKTAATGPASSASACMNITVHNAETFSADDIIYLSDQGGDYTSKLWPPSSGSSDHPIIYMAVSGESPTIDMTGQADHCITCYGRSYLTLSSLRLTGADTNKYGFILGNSHHITVDSCTIDTNYRGIAWTHANVDIYNITISNCTIHTNDETGIWWNTGDNDPGESGKAYNITISKNIIRDNGLHGIKCNTVNLAGGSAHYTSALTIQNNKVYGNNFNGFLLGDVDNDQGANIISNNEIYNNGDNPGVSSANGLWLGNCSYIIIENNTLYNNNTGDIDGVGILLDTRGAGYESNNCIIRYNLCYNHDSCNDQVPWHGSDSAFNSSGIGLCCGVHDNIICYNICNGNAVGLSLGGAAGVTTMDNDIFNNTLVNNRLGLQVDLQNAGSTGNDIRNNIIAHNTMGILTNYGMYIDATTVVASSNVTIDYNAWYDNDTDFSDNSGQGWSQGSHKVETDPQLSADFRLCPQSPWIIKTGGDKSAWFGVADITDFDGKAITNADGKIVTDNFKISIDAHQFIEDKFITSPIKSGIGHGIKRGIQ